jgi:MFS family permease
VGMGLAMAPFFNIVLAGVDDEETGSASGALTSVQQLGGAFGIAVLGTVFFDLAAERSFAEATWRGVLVAIVLLAVAFGLTFLLPRHARPDADGSH